jgi:hypothetical protein
VRLCSRASCSLQALLAARMCALFLLQPLRLPSLSWPLSSHQIELVPIFASYLLSRRALHAAARPPPSVWPHRRPPPTPPHEAVDGSGECSCRQSKMRDDQSGDRPPAVCTGSARKTTEEPHTELRRWVGGAGEVLAALDVSADPVWVGRSRNRSGKGFLACLRWPAFPFFARRITDR